MNLHATRTDGETVTVQEPIPFDVGYTLNGDLAILNQSDLTALYDALPNGASPSERGDIELYLCQVAESAAE